MNILSEIDDILNGAPHSVFVGRSATQHKRFATIRKGTGETVSTGLGDTAEEALRDAVQKMRGVPVETAPVAPSGIVTRMPG